MFTSNKRVVTLWEVGRRWGARSFVVNNTLYLIRIEVVLNILNRVSFFKGPGVVRNLAVPIAGPFMTRVVRVVRVNNISSGRSSIARINVSLEVRGNVLFWFCYVRSLLLFCVLSSYFATGSELCVGGGFIVRFL